MDRLTLRLKNGMAGIALEHEELYTMDEWVDALQSRLADYEDTGYSPEDFDELCREMSDLRIALGLDTYPSFRKEMKGKHLLMVPRPGSVLFEVDGEHGIITHVVTDVHWVANTVAVDDKGMEWGDYYTDEDIYTAHKTRETAEAELASGYIIREG